MLARIYLSTLILLLLISSIQSVFYRKIPFKYKSVVEKPWWINTEENNISGIISSKEDKDNLEGEQNIAQLLEEIEKSSLESPDETEEMEEYNNYNKIKENKNKLQKINNKLIINKNNEEIIPKNILIETEDNLPTYTHLMAFRPDYNIRNFASFLRRFLDSRIIAATIDDNQK